MEVKVDKRYPLEVDAARAWLVLRDVRTVAECMPGASIDEQVDPTHFKGSVRVKVGPANAAFAGDIEVLALDEVSKKLQLLGKGADRGGSSASMDLTATIEPGESSDTSVLVGVAAVIVNGKFAQFGGRLMVQVSDMLLAQFADNFRAKAAALPAASSPAVEVSQSAPAPAASADASTPATPVSSLNPPRPAATIEAPTPRSNEINAPAILWQLVKGWFAGLFGKRA
jgi:carbon monoxide dehydrogenase subunit G